MRPIGAGSNTIHFGAKSPPPPEEPQAPQNTRSVKGGKGFDRFNRTVKNAITGNEGGTSLVGRLWNGVKRTLTKTFLRPRGYVELLLAMTTGVGIIFPIKHFVEGVLGVNSLFIKRKIKIFPHLHSKNNEYETIQDMLNGNKNLAYIARQPKANQGKEKQA